jgi:membrane protein YdbS with pleckstrin-like domain
MEKLHPGVMWKFRIDGFFTIVFLGFIIYIVSAIVWLFGNMVEYGADGSGLLIGFFNIGGEFNFMWLILGVILIGFIFSIIYSNMAYKRWKYEFNSQGLKIEHGIIWKKFSNIPYERVQNVDIQRGLIARMFGFSTVNIHTAGSSGYSPVQLPPILRFFVKHGRGHARTVGIPKGEGHLPGVSVNGAEKIRELLMSRINKGEVGRGM